MDDLYNNAWGDPVNPDSKSTSSAFGTSQSSSWISPKLPHSPHDDEADLAAPSWSTGTGIKWNEPSEDDTGFGWSHSEPDLAWGSSTYDTLHIGKVNGTHAIQEPQSPEVESFAAPTYVPEDELEAEVTPHQSPYQPPKVLKLQEGPTPSEESSSPPQSPVSPERTPVTSRSPSPDGFGTFDNVVLPDPALGIDDDAWGSAWAVDTSPKMEEQNEVVDEWETAKKQKEQQDRVVPPELVAEIMNRCTEFCDVMWPDVSSPFVDSDKDSWRNRLRTGMEGIEGLEGLKKELLPEFVLPPAVKFNKTAIAKHMAKDINLTRNLPMVKNSPMSHYMASKGSTAWEQAVKERKEVSEDDVVPVGWRILEKESHSPVMDASKAQKSGGFFSFFNRRESKGPATAVVVGAPTPVRSQSPAPVAAGKPKANAPSERTASSARGSLDSRRSMSVNRSTEATSSSTVASPVSSTPPVPLPTVTPWTAPASSDIPQTPSTGGSYADAPEPVFESTQAPPPAPSAVSRFLGRFSRRRSAVPTSSPHTSIALSSDDLEFLSDIVPSVNDDPADDPLEQLSRSAAMKPQPLPPMLPPPPVAPPLAPPSAPPPRLQSIPSTKTIPLPPLVPSQLAPGKALPAQPPNQVNDFDSFFDALETKALEPEKPAVLSRSSTPRSMGSSPLQPTPVSRFSPPPPSRSQSPGVFALPQSSRPASPFPQARMSPVERPPSQPMLPPPPSSRSQSPAITSLPRRGSSTQVGSTNAKPTVLPPSTSRSGSQQSHPLRPRIPLSFVIPPPPSSQPIRSASSSTSPTSPVPTPESALPTPTSARPLVELYPNAVRQNNGTAFPLPITNSSNTQPSLFMIPPPPSSRPHTPATLITTSQHSGAVPPPLPLPPPPSQLTLPSPLDDNDDDDFSDFQSSATLPPLKPPPSTPASKSRQQGPAQSATLPGPSSFLAPLPPPPKSSSTWGFNTPPHPHALAGGFPPFRTPSPPSLRSDASPTPDLDSSFTSNQGLLPHANSSSGFDDWDSFNTNPLRTPSPPRPPTKTPGHHPLPPPPGRHKVKADNHSLPPIVSKSPPTSPKMRNREAEHQHTLSLVEMAAARRGQWPAPPSPLPQAIAFPFPAPGKNSKGPAVDLMGEDDIGNGKVGSVSSFGKFGSSEGIVVPSSVSSPAVLNPTRLAGGVGGSGVATSSLFGPGSGMMKTALGGVGQSQSLQTVSSTGSNQWLLNAGSSSNGSFGSSLGGGVNSGSVGNSRPGAGGLSAQDLSFFEGL